MTAGGAGNSGESGTYTYPATAQGGTGTSGTGTGSGSYGTGSGSGSSGAGAGGSGAGAGTTTTTAGAVDVPVQSSGSGSAVPVEGYQVQGEEGVSGVPLRAVAGPQAPEPERPGPPVPVLALVAAGLVVAAAFFGPGRSSPRTCGASRGSTTRGRHGLCRSGRSASDTRRPMKILISIDDTDDIDSRGTGDVAELMAQGLTDSGLAECGRVTRHQLLVHPDIAYTSHNSAMCFPAEVDAGSLDAVTAWCQATLAAESVAAADPGLCVAAVESLVEPDALVAYGRDAKERVFSKDEAYRIAGDLRVHLSEHGGTGIGVIGALAGAGLRLSGNDGRFKGKFAIPGDESGVARVRDIRGHGVDSVRTLDGDVLGDEEPVLVGPECKLVLLAGEAVLLVAPADGAAPAPWTVVDRRALRSY